MELRIKDLPTNEILRLMYVLFCTYEYTELIQIAHVTGNQQLYGIKKVIHHLSVRLVLTAVGV